MRGLRSQQNYRAILFIQRIDYSFIAKRFVSFSVELRWLVVEISLDATGGNNPCHGYVENCAVAM
jgi:hypothetical protein